LAIYDHIGGRKLLQPTRSLALSRDRIARVLDERFTRAFEYSDCWVDDARLVVLNARDAADRGAEIAVRTRVTAVRPQEDGWLADLEDQAVGKPYSVEARKVGTRHVRARMIVNAAGPWADIVARSAFGNNATSRIRLVRGSHIVLRYRLPDERAFIFQNADGRVMFAIPYEGTFTLVGTTDAETEADPSQATPSGEEIDYLLAGISENLRTTFTRADVAWQFAAVRPLLDSGEAGDAQDATRDYTLSLEHPRGAPLMTVLGGKLTTYRRLAEAALEKIEAELGPVDTRSAGWTGKVQLPGGDFPRGGADALAQRLRADFPFLAAATCERLVRSYGTRAWDMLGAATSCEDLGTHFGAGLTAREIEFLQRTEFAQTAEDILWRRTKCGLHMTAEERDRVADHLGEVAAPPTAAGG
ncbi:MAG: glycerol-3-phosphate dehydrogenase, partial [Pseudomonadota bacterium]